MQLRPRGILLILVTGLTLSGCGSTSDGAPVSNDYREETEPLLNATEHPLLPIPQPEGAGAVGARLREYRIELTRDTVPAGEVEFHVINSGTTAHWLIVRDDTLFVGTPHLQPGDSAILRVDLSPGEYNLVCTIRDEFDHISEGMRNTIVVR